VELPAYTSAREYSVRERTRVQLSEYVNLSPPAQVQPGELIPSWVLNCKNCTEKFHHSEIPVNLENRRASQTRVPDQREIECPNRHGKAVYQRIELTYRV
jgi:hypothetical protein